MNTFAAGALRTCLERGRFNPFRNLRSHAMVTPSDITPVVVNWAHYAFFSRFILPAKPHLSHSAMCVSGGFCGKGVC